ncbi:hypothetical protein BX592_11448 [Paraburkholderia rhizosphaerae]|uniref:Uncharacterized protein n=1 Tax=Paraburkholderia rhizosphaerae TaxID=480658 RepID=A0A4R8LNM4_9BURK|nr:hypothetical protein BX592_11448 [Paraburkholderia rhizosphaerae]
MLPKINPRLAAALTIALRKRVDFTQADGFGEIGEAFRADLVFQMNRSHAGVLVFAHRANHVEWDCRNR